MSHCGMTKFGEERSVCPKTLSGMHLYRELVIGWSATKQVGSVKAEEVVKCIACGMIDDRDK